ncbi:MAG TPA: hypothetical protein VEC36_12580, partial [Patescibacteria group bacterium]|nr:hypothetical protein [Patescibacteria group bacterium]
MKYSSWLIISTLTLIPAFTGCTTSPVKRKLPSLAQFEKQKGVVKPVPQEIKPIRDEEIAFKSDTALEPIPTGKRLPTLREQMQKIANNQETITARHNEFSGDVVEIKRDMVQMKESLEDIKGVLEEMRGQKPQTFSKGAGEDIQPNVRVLKSTPVSEEILPDNVASETFNDNVIQSDKYTKKAQPTKKKVANLLPKDSGTKNNALREAPIKKQEISVKAIEKSKADAIENPNNHPVYTTAISLFKKRNFAETITLLEGLLKTEKSPATVSNCHYWVGESYFGLGQFSQAIASFKKV